MSHQRIVWRKRHSWVAVFDILGFKNRIADVAEDLPRAVLTDQIADLLGNLDCVEARQGELTTAVFSDTIVVFSPDLSAASYPWFLAQCRNLMTASIPIRLPIRGAISAGTTFEAEQHPIYIGPAFLEAHEYCEDQDWLGLVLTPSATKAAIGVGLDPVRHGFVDCAVPLRNQCGADVLAYRFQNSGSTNFASPLIPILEEMEQAPTSAREKYSRTIDHIRRHYQVHATDGRC
jgi:hypothetical protein